MIAERREGDLKPLLVRYLKEAPNPDCEGLIELALASPNQYIVAETIKCLSYRNYDSESYRQLLRHGLNWPNEDFLDDVLLSSLRRVAEYSIRDAETKKRLESLLAHESPFVQDAAFDALAAFHSHKHRTKP